MKQYEVLKGNDTEDVFSSYSEAKRVSKSNKDVVILCYDTDLENALCKAQKAAYAVENTPDGGASNFDEVILVTSVKKYDLHAMDINLELVAKDTYSVDFNLNGQGERRSAMAQAACKSLQKSGYKAYVKYILD